MSDLSELLHGNPNALPKIVADLKKDFAFVQAFPFAKQLEALALGAIEGALAHRLSPTMVALFMHEIRDALGIPNPIPAPAA